MSASFPWSSNVATFSKKEIWSVWHFLIFFHLCARLHLGLSLCRASAMESFELASYFCGVFLRYVEQAPAGHEWNWGEATSHTFCCCGSTSTDLFSLFRVVSLPSFLQISSFQLLLHIFFLCLCGLLPPLEFPYPILSLLVTVFLSTIFGVLFYVFFFLSSWSLPMACGIAYIFQKVPTVGLKSYLWTFDI